MKKAIELKSNRLILKPLDVTHCSLDYLRWLNDEDVYRYLETGGNYNMHMLKEYIEESVFKNIYFWAIHLKSDDKHIGNIKIDPINLKLGTGEYGILMGDKNEWGKGYAKEASLTIIDYCFNIIGLRKITLGVISENISAINLYKKLGFELEGTFKYHGFYNGKWCSCFRMTLFNNKFSY